ncbi:MAG: hypothetical protein LUI85_19125 [Bacteroides sp.]|nr:hypothetical protein [Bacteroides sp.]
MNETIEELKESIRNKVGRFGFLDQTTMYNELINFCDEEIRLSMMQEYGTTGWDDENE